MQTLEVRHFLGFKWLSTIDRRCWFPLSEVCRQIEFYLKIRLFSLKNLPLKSMLRVERVGELGFKKVGILLALKGANDSSICSRLRGVRPRFSVLRLNPIAWVSLGGGTDRRPAPSNIDLLNGKALNTSDFWGSSTFWVTLGLLRLNSWGFVASGFKIILVSIGLKISRSNCRALNLPLTLISNSESSSVES